MQNLTDLTVSEIIHSLRAGDFSSRELTQAYLSRIDALEKDLHAFLTITPELAYSQADQADRRLAGWRKDPGADLPPLLGVPAAIKDVLCVQDVPCTCGSRILENFVPPFHATVVEKLLSAGVVILGKTNTDEFAMGSSTENSAYRSDTQSLGF